MLRPGFTAFRYHDNEIQLEINGTPSSKLMRYTDLPKTCFQFAACPFFPPLQNGINDFSLVLRRRSEFFVFQTSQIYTPRNSRSQCTRVDGRIIWGHQLVGLTVNRQDVRKDFQTMNASQLANARKPSAVIRVTTVLPSTVSFQSK